MRYHRIPWVIFAVAAMLIGNRSTIAQDRATDPCIRRTSTQDNRVKVIYYNARRNEFRYENGGLVSGPMDIGEHVVLEVCHARFGEQFIFTLTEKILPEAGAPVRGLDDAAGLIKGLPGSPVAKGVALLESVKFATFPDVGAVIARLRSLQDIIELRTELRLDLESIQYGSDVLDEDYKKYRRAICQMTDQILLADCSNLGMPLTASTGMPPRVDMVEAKIQRLREELRKASSGVPSERGPETPCPSNFNPPGGQGYADRNQFVCFVNLTNQVIGQFKTLRSMMQQPPLGSSAADLIAALEEYKLRLFTYGKKLEQVRAAIDIEKVLLSVDPNVLLSRLKKLQESYKDVITPEGLQAIADQQKTFLHSQERKEIMENLNQLEMRGGELSRIELRVKELTTAVVRRIDEVRNVDLFFGARVYQANKTLALEALELYALYEKSEVDPFFVQMFTWSGNTGVILGARASDSFKPLDLNKLELPVEATGADGAVAALNPTTGAVTPVSFSAPAQSTAQQAPPATTSATPTPSPTSGQAPSGNASTVATTEFPVTAGTTTAFEVHKTYRFNVAAGVLFSSVSQDNFALRNVPSKDKNGNPTTNLLLVATGKDHVRVDFPVFLMTYLGKPLDVFTASSANQRKFGTAVGFSSLDVSNNAYAGAFFQPRLGLDFLFGLHLARRNVPDRGITPNMTILDPGTTTPPIHQEWKPGLFLTVGFDALTFKKLFFGAN